MNLMWRAVWEVSPQEYWRLIRKAPREMRAMWNYAPNVEDPHVPWEDIEALEPGIHTIIGDDTYDIWHACAKKLDVIREDGHVIGNSILSNVSNLRLAALHYEAVKQGVYVLCFADEEDEVFSASKTYVIENDRLVLFDKPNKIDEVEFAQAELQALIALRDKTLAKLDSLKQKS